MLIVIYLSCKRIITKKAGEYMTEGEMLKISVEEFSRIQRYMMLAEKDSEVYMAMKERYTDLKVILSASGVNLTEIDRIKE